MRASHGKAAAVRGMSSDQENGTGSLRSSRAQGMSRDPAQPGGADFAAVSAPHAESTDALLARLDVARETGLSGAQAARRLALHGANALRRRAPVNIALLLLGQLASPVVYLLIGAALLAFLLGEMVEFAAIVIVLAINTLIGFVTELQALRSMEALRQLASRSAIVRRDGRQITVNAEDLVPGDIVILDAGDVVAADMRILLASDLSVDESMLTGESLPVEKSAEPVDAAATIHERTSMLFKGCAISRGTGEAVVTATGMATELGRITKLVEEAEPDRSPLERQLEQLSRNLIWLTLIVTAAVALTGIWSGRDLLKMIESAVALAVAAIPEGLPIVATLALARGMLRMARRNALLERLSAVETLGATTVILTDKTGTLTENAMHVERIVTPAGSYGLDRGQGRLLDDGGAPLPQPGAALTRLLRSAALCNNAELSGEEGAATGDPMEIALLRAAQAGGMTKPALLADCPERKEYAFRTSTRMMATVHDGGKGMFAAVKGAPEAVFAAISSVQDEDGAKPFDREEEDRWRAQCEHMAGEGLRLLAIAGKPMATLDEPVYEGLTLFGVAAFRDPPRSDIAAAISEAKRAGIKVVMVTGDHPATARHVSREVGLSGDGDHGIVGGELEAFDGLAEGRRQALRDTRIFARVDPAQKLDLIRLHQEAGDVVAMTGDGVNDAPALRKADIGIAMGLRGTQVARDAADLVLRDDRFPTIIEAIREGRVIFMNIRRFVVYLLSCNLSEILVVGLAVPMGLPLPILPLQILFLNLVTDVFPAFALGTIEADDGVLDRPPRPPAEPILARRHWTRIVFYGVLIALTTLAALAIAMGPLALTGNAVTTMTFHTLALAQLLHVFSMRNMRDRFLKSRLTRNGWVWGAVVLCLGILAVAQFQPHLANMLSLVPLPAEAWAAVAALAFVPVIAGRLFGILFARDTRKTA